MAGVRRVLVVSSMYPTTEHAAGGIFVHEQVRALRSLGLDARVVTGRPTWMPGRRPLKALRVLLQAQRENWPGWDAFEGVPVARFPVPAGSFVPPWLYPWSYAAALRRWLPRLTRDFAYDLVHTHTAFVDGRAGISAARHRGVPMVLTEHTGPLRTVTADRRWRLHTQAGMDGADCLVAVSQALRRDMLDQLDIRDPARVLVLPNGVDTSFFDPALARPCPPGERDTAAFRRPGAVHALWVGHHVEVKAVDRLLDAFAVARRHQPGLVLSLLGDGPLEPARRRQAQALGLESAVRFLSGAGREGVRDAMAAADFLVLPSHAETFGVVVIEALAMGKPVLATACGGPEDVLADDPRLGLLAGNTMHGVALGLQRMAAGLGGFDPRQIRAVAVDRYDYARLGTRLLALYEDVANAPAAG